MQIEKLRSLIRESINEYIREIDDQGTGAMFEAKKQACEAAIEKREAKLRSIDKNEELKEMVDAGKLKDIQKEIAELKKYHKKLINLQEKHSNKGKKKEMTTDAKTDEEAPIDESDVTAEMELDEASKKQTFKVNNLQHSKKHKPFKKLRKEKPGTNRIAPSNQTDNEEDEPWNQGKTKHQPMDETMINESFIRMQKIAGIIK
jgi:hypothetical protein